MAESSPLAKSPERNQPQKESGAPQPVVTALRLGWAISELPGRLRKGVRPYPLKPKLDPNDGPRLTTSEGTVKSSQEAFLLTAHRVVEFSKTLDLLSDSPADKLDQAVYYLPDAVADWLRGTLPRFYTLAALRNLLNRWSLRRWAMMNARDDASARAFTLGMSLADTYWYPTKPLPPDPNEVKDHSRIERIRLAQASDKPGREDWRYFLAIYRLDVERGRFENLKPYLPSYISDVLRGQLRDWSIGTELEYTTQGKLRRRHILFRRSHPLGFLARLKGGTHSPQLLPEDEIALYDALARQMERWSGLVFQLRDPLSYLYHRDRVFIVLGRWLGTALALAALLIVVNLLWQLTSPAISQAVGPVFAAFQQPTKIEPSVWIALAGFVLTVLGSLALALREGYRALQRSYRFLDHWLTTRFIAWRTRVPWDRYLTRKAMVAPTGNESTTKATTDEKDTA